MQTIRSWASEDGMCQESVVHGASMSEDIKDFSICRAGWVDRAGECCCVERG